MGSNQHYVPQFLLRNFAEANKVYRFDKKIGIVEYKSIRSVCSQDNFYNISINQLCKNQPSIKKSLLKILGNTTKDINITCDNIITLIETKTGEIIKKILLYKNITILCDKEKQMLCLFTAIQMLRTLHHRNAVKKILEAISNKVKKISELEPDISVKYESWIEDNLGKDLDISAKLMSIINLIPFAINQARNLFFSKHIFLIDTLNDNLYISDSPVVFDNKNDYSPYGSIGTLVPGIEIYLPLSSRIILAFHCKTLLPPYNVLNNISNDYLEKITAIKTGGCVYQSDIEPFFNYLQMNFSERYLIAKKDCFDYAKNKIKKYPQLKSCTITLRTN